MCLILTEEQKEHILDVAFSVNNNQEEGIFYKYEGQPAERAFCKTLLSLNKLYTKEDINRMSFQGVNSQFAQKDRSKYSIFKYVGGKNCKHHWRKIEVRMDENGLPVEYDRGIVDNSPVEGFKLNKETMDVFELILDEDNLDGVYGASLVAEPAIDLEGMFFNSKAINHKEQPIKWQLSSEEKRTVVAPVLVPNKKIFRESVGKDKKQGMTFVSAETIEKLQQNFFKQKYNHNSTLEHLEAIEGVYFFESWIVIDPQNDKSNALGFSNLEAGTWMMAMKVDNDDIWNNYVKTGLVRGLSIDALLRPVKQEDNELNKFKFKTMNKKTINAIVKNAIQRVAMSADLQSFLLEDGTEIKSTELELESVVIDAEGNTYADKQFTYQGFNYLTDEFGVIIMKDAVDAEQVDVIEFNEDLTSLKDADGEREYFLEGTDLAEGVAVYSDVEKTPLADGEYMLTENTTIEVEGGLVKSVKITDENVVEFSDELLAEKDLEIESLKETVVKLEEEISNLKTDNVLKENEVVMLKKNKPASKGIIDRPSTISYSAEKGKESDLDVIKRLNKLNKNK